jgi:hypothetical protein
MNSFIAKEFYKTNFICPVILQASEDIWLNANDQGLC